MKCKQFTVDERKISQGEIDDEGTLIYGCHEEDAMIITCNKCGKEYTKHDFKKIIK